jgi:hypothetical protein
MINVAVRGIYIVKFIISSLPRESTEFAIIAYNPAIYFCLQRGSLLKNIAGRQPRDSEPHPALTFR